MHVALRSDPLDPFQELAAFSAGLEGARSGASSIFIGTMRDFNEGENVAAMFLEHYPGMTEKFLERIAAEAAERWPLDALYLEHRVGEIQPAEAIVVIGVWTAHRGDAFAACRYLIEELKSRAPFWKRETRPDGPRWVAGNTPS
ncbi:MAG TPA: molybdenum cofactor biosynthesis protein MoaE [Gammaproteobacteria bacterium]|nr:molybdenum cofactor biosynthesis protein MoaE [Gammaproteobacteria bacterium]